MSSRLVVRVASRATLVAAIAWSAACNRGGQGSTHPQGAPVTGHTAASDGSARQALQREDQAGGVNRYAIPVTMDQPSRGPADALVTLVVFSEFQCPFCSRVTPTLDRLLRQYPTELRIVWRNLPLGFHENAMPAAELAREAFAQGGDDMFWELHDVLFENQRDLARDNLDRFAREAGLDMVRYQAAMDAHTHRDAIEADMSLASQVGASGTPNSFINGVQVTGAQPYEAFNEVVVAELAHARRFVQAGTPASRVYAEVTRDGLTEAAPDYPREARPQPNPATIYSVPLDGELPQRGPDDALVTIVVFSDIQCPFCARAEPTMTRLLDEYGGDLRVVWMNNPLGFHPNAMPAAIAVQEAFQQGGNALFWRLHVKLFENQRDLSRENIERLAGEAGVDVGQLQVALDQNEHQPLIEAQQRLAQSLGATGTPAFFINGRNVRGAQPFQTFAAVVDEELVRARALVASGTPRAGVYAAAIQGGATTPQVVQPEGTAAPAPSDVPEPTRTTLAIPPDAPSRGVLDAAVVIQEVSDYQCPFCARVQPTIERLLAAYHGRVRLVWRDLPLPFHQNAHVAAQAAREVYRQGGDTSFWAYNALLFANQRDLSRETLLRLAGQVGGVDVGELARALDTQRHRAAVDADSAAAQAAGVRGTPGFVINGELVSGAQPYPVFEAAVERALAAANP